MNNLGELKTLYNKILEFKEKGNKEYNNENDTTKNRALSYYQIAITLYNNNSTIIKTTTPTTEEKEEFESVIKYLNKLMGILYSNISLIYLNIIEIVKAMEYSQIGLSFDEKTNSKCYYRNALAKRGLSQYLEAVESLDKAIAIEQQTNTSSLLKLYQSEKKQIEEKIQKSIKEEENFNTSMKKEDQYFKQFPNVSVVWKQGYGRVTLANKPMVKGTIVIRVAPFASTIQDADLFKYCGFCLQKVEKSKRAACLCNGCKLHVICSACRSSESKVAIKYHSEICDIFAFLNRHHPNSESRDFRMMSRIFVNIVNGRNGKQSKHPTVYNGETSNDGRPYISDDYQEYLNLARETKISDPEMKAKVQRGASSMINLVQSVRGYGYFNKLPKDEMMSLYSTITLNAHTFTSVLKEHDYGRGIFPTASYFNHSCSPNATWYIDDQGMMVITTLTSIAPGEELFLSYLDNTDIVGQRRETLFNQYSFFCQCELCEFQNNLTGILCKECDEPLYEPSRKYHEPTNEKDCGFTFTCCNGHVKSIEFRSQQESSSEFMSSNGNPQHTDQRTFSHLNYFNIILEARDEFEKIKGKLTPNQFEKIAANFPPTLLENNPTSELYQQLINAYEQVNEKLSKVDSSILKTPIVFGSHLFNYFKLFQALKSELPLNVEKLELIKNHILETIDKNQYQSFKNQIDKLLNC